MYEEKYRVVGMWEMGWSDLDQGPGKAFLRKGCLSAALEESAQVRWDAESTRQSREHLHRRPGTRSAPQTVRETLLSAQVGARPYRPLSLY